MDVRDQLVELILRLIVVAAPDEPHVDGGVPAIGDHREQDVVTLLYAARPLLDRRDPLGEDALIIAECLARRRGDELPLATLQRRQLQVTTQVVLLNHVGDGAENVDQLGDVDKLAEALDRFVGSRRLQFELGACVAKRGCPGIELVDAPRAQRFRSLEAEQGVHLAQRVGDGRAGGLDECAARLVPLNEP